MVSKLGKILGMAPRSSSKRSAPVKRSTPVKRGPMKVGAGRASKTC